MSFKNINNFFLILIIFLPFSCKTIDKFSSLNNKEIYNSDNLELNEKIILKEKNISNKTYIDFYTNNFYNNLIIEENLNKKYNINNFKKSYDEINPLKVYIIDNYIYGVDFKSNFNIYDLENGKLINSIELFTKKNKNIPIPTSMSLYDNHFIIGFKTGKVIKINREGKIIWEYKHDKILTSPIKIFKQNLIILYGDTIKLLSIENGKELLSETYEGSNILNSKGGSIEEFANILYFILPNSSLAEIDSFFNEKIYSNFANNNFQDSINNNADEIHIFDNYISYFDNNLYLYCFDIYSDKFILNERKISNVNSFKFFNNSLIVKNNETITAYNLKNGKIFWSFEINKMLKKDTNIVNVLNIDNKIGIFLDNGDAIIIENNEIINLFNLKIKNINFIYSQDYFIFFSLKNGKTTIF